MITRLDVGIGLLSFLFLYSIILTIIGIIRKPNNRSKEEKDGDGTNNNNNTEWLLQSNHRIYLFTIYYNNSALVNLHRRA